jgi:hypothetical protein
MQFYDNKNALSGFILDVFIQNRPRSYLTLLCSFRSYFTRVHCEHGLTQSHVSNLLEEAVIRLSTIQPEHS